MNIKELKKEELKTIINIVKSYDFIIYNGIPYLFYDQNFIKCSLKNIKKISFDLPVFNHINIHNYNTFINKILIYNLEENIIINNDNILKFNNCLLNFKNFRILKNFSKDHPFFLIISQSLIHKKNNNIKFINYFLKNMAHDNYNDVLNSLYNLFTIKNNNIFLFKINSEGRNFVDNYLNDVFIDYDFLHVKSNNIKLTSDDLYDKNLLILEVSALIGNEYLLNIIKRKLVDKGKIVKRNIIFTGNIFLYATNKTEVEFVNKNLLHLITSSIDLYSKNKNIKFLYSNFKEEIEDFIYFLIKYQKDNIDTIEVNNCSTLFNNNEIHKDWIKRTLIDMLKRKEEIIYDKIFFKYKKFCKLFYINTPLKKTFYFYVKSINNEINYEGNNFIKNIYIKK